MSAGYLGEREGTGFARLTAPAWPETIDAKGQGDKGTRMLPRPRKGRKLLVASLGVATMTYVGVQCGGSTSNGGGEKTDAKSEATADAVDDFPVANLVAPPYDAKDDVADAQDDFPVANLVPPPDSGMD